jgi:hypothetical protein
MLRLATNNPTVTPLEPLRAELADAIARHAEAAAALRENEAAQDRADTAKWSAITAVEKAKESLAQAADADADAIATGRTRSGTALAKARARQQLAEDTLAAARRAEAMLTEQHAALASTAGILAMRVDSAVAAVMKEADETAALVAEFYSTRSRYFDLHGAMRALWRANALTAATNGWDYAIPEDRMPVSAVAATISEWFKQLKTNADAMLR